MSLKSTSSRYGAVPIGLHWLTAILIVALFILGISADNAADDPTRRALLIPHIGLGLLVLALTLFRIVWWLAADKRPDALPGLPRWQERLSRIVHILAYGFIIALAVTGIATNVSSGMIGALSAGSPLPSLDAVPPRQGHGVLAWSFMALLVLHVGAALYHHFIRRDGLLARMGIGTLPQ